MRGLKSYKHVLQLPDIGVLSEVDLVSTEKRRQVKNREREKDTVANLNVRP